MSILPSPIRLGAEAMFSMKQCGLFAGGSDRLGHALLRRPFMRSERRILSQLLEWINQIKRINRFLSESDHARIICLSLCRLPKNEITDM
jgi:hypothetical protein